MSASHYLGLGAPDPPCSLSNHFPSQPPPSTHGLPCFFSGICSYFENAIILAILTLLYTTNIILDLLLSTHYLSGPTSSSPYFHYLYFIPILVDRPTQLICTFHLFFHDKAKRTQQGNLLLQYLLSSLSCLS